MAKDQTKKSKKAEPDVSDEKPIVEETVVEKNVNQNNNDPKSDEEEEETKGLTKEEKEKLKRKKKKEKEKEKKRKEKEGQKTEEADEKTEESAVRTDSGTPEPLKPEDGVDSGAEGRDGNDDEDKAATKKKKKKAKEKEKKEKEKKEKDKKEGKSKQKKLIQELLEARQAAEEAQRRAIEEEERRQRELEEKKAEEERRELERKEEAKRRKAELIQQQKRDGTFLTKKQRQQLERARSLFQNQNIIVPAAVSGDGERPKKPYYGKKKPPKKTQTQAGTSDEAKPPTPVVEETAEPTPVEVDDVAQKLEKVVVDDWEQLSDSDVSTVPAAAVESKSKSSDDTPPSAGTPTPSVGKKEDEAGKVQRITKADDIGKRSGSVESESESSSSDDSSDNGESGTESEEITSTAPSVRETREMLFAKVRAKIAKRRELALSKCDPNVLRSPIICVLGHVDTGKTKMLDTIRRTNVQDGEAGGITQQIGATDVPARAIVERCRQVKDFNVDEIQIPGFLIIDTPGHESFANLRSRGSSLCDIAILVVDIMHGLEPQTIESLKLLLKRKTPFVVALNKVDRLYGYESNPRKDIYQHLKTQSINVQLEFKERWEKIITEFAEQGLNVTLSKDNKDFDEYVSVVPTSAQLGDGIGNLMAHIVFQSQTFLHERLIFSEELNCIVMEVRAIAGLGTTIDVILVNGRLRNDDIIVLSGIDGPIVTAVRDLLTPPPLREMRIKSDYHHFKEIKGAQGVKVLAKELDKVVAGLPLFVAHAPDELDVLKEDAEEQLSSALMAIKKKSEGVYVQASTLGSLEALLEFLKTQKIPYSNVNIGPVHKKDVQKAAAMLEHNKEFACILAFDVPITREAQQVADKEGVRIFQANIIYHLEDSFLKYREELRLKRRRENEHLAVYPVKLRVLPQNIFNARNPIVIGVSVEAGHLKKGTPICAKTAEGIIFLGTVSSIERNHEQIDMAKHGDEVCVKIENTTGDAPKMYGRHFTHIDMLISRISRESIDVCKIYFRDDLTRADWQLIVELKKVLGIM